MCKKAVIRVLEIVGGPICVAAEDGQIIYDRIAPLIRDGQKVMLSFQGVEILIPAFLNVAVSRLYSEFTEEQIRESLLICDISSRDLNLLTYAMNSSKAYFENREAYDRAWKEVVGDEE